MSLLSSPGRRRREPVPHHRAGGDSAAASAPHWMNEERVLAYSWIMAVVFLVTLVIWVWQSLPTLVDPTGKALGNDFLQFWSAARLALAGRPEAAFDLRTLIGVEHATVPALPNLLAPWSSPPTFLLVVMPFGLLPYPVALALFLTVTAGLWALLVRRVIPGRRAWIVAAAAPAGLVTLVAGQNGFLTAAIAGFALLLLDRRPIAAGLLIGLLAIKPHLAVLFPLALIAAGRWRTFVAAAASTSAFAIASVVAFGWDTTAAFVANLSRAQGFTDSGQRAWSELPTPYVFGLSLGLPHAGAIALQAAAALFGALCVWRVWRNPGTAFEARAATLLAASLLVSPYLSHYDLTWAALAVGWLAALGLKTGFRRGEREILLLAWLAPMLIPPVQMMIGWQLGFLTLLPLLIMAVRRAALPA